MPSLTKPISDRLSRVPQDPPDKTALQIQEIVQSILEEGDLWDWDLTHVEIGQSYSSRRFEHALRHTGSRKVSLMASAIATLVFGVTAGVTWESLQRGFIAGAITLALALIATALVYYLTDAPKEIDEALREDLEAGKKQLKEEKRKLLKVANLIDSLDRSRLATLTELSEQYALERSDWLAEKRDLEKQLEGIESDLTRARENIEKLYRNYRQKHLSQTKEINSLKDQVLAEKTKNATPDLYGKIKEVYFKPTSDGLYITLRVHIGNRGADTTIQPFVLKFLLKGREYTALAEDDVTDYSIVRTIDKPLWPSYTRETEAKELTDLSEDNLKPLDHHRHREGWLRFRIPQLVAYMRGEGGELTLEIIDAIDRVVSIKVSPPWPQDGVIRFSRALQAEWDEAVKRSQERQAKEVDSQESAPPDAS
jgi:hypothetical protein